MNMDMFASWPFRQIIRDPFSLDCLKSNPHVNVTWLRVEGVHGGLPTDLSYTMMLAHEYRWYHRICEYILAKVSDSQEAGSELPLLFDFYKLAHKTSGYLFGAWLPYGCLYNVIFWFYKLSCADKFLLVIVEVVQRTIVCSPGIVALFSECVTWTVSHYLLCIQLQQKKRMCSGFLPVD
jgi:hypothetical protein